MVTSYEVNYALNVDVFGELDTCVLARGGVFVYIHKRLCAK